MRKSELMKINENGFTWSWRSQGICHFTKKTDEGYLLLRCTIDQLHNGDFEYMAHNGLSLSKEECKKRMKMYVDQETKEYA